MTIEAAVDIAIVTILPNEYRAVHELLRDPQHDPGTPHAPNLNGWELGWIDRADGSGSYRVVLALAGRAGNVTASQATIAIVERWNARYVLLVGIAGGFPVDGCALGDVVVSSVIYGYEHGKIEGSFQPRPHWVYRPDPALLASATRFAAIQLQWSDGLGRGSRGALKALAGAVASGEKVVDDPTNAFFAAVQQAFPRLQAVEMEGAGAASAIEHLQAGGRQAGFIMIRGISDMPKTAATSAQSAERDSHKDLACAAAARFATRWISSGWPVPVIAGTQDTGPGLLPASTAPTTPPHQAEPGSVPTRRSLRRLLDQALPNIVDFDTFILDEFADVYNRLSRGMDRVEKTNSLFLEVATETILATLRRHAPARAAQHERVLEFEPRPR